MESTARSRRSSRPSKAPGSCARLPRRPPQRSRRVFWRGRRGGLFVFLYSSNPFYILSADLVFVGLRISFGPGGPAAHLGSGLSLAGYTLLLATTACFLIRVGSSGTTCAACCS